MTQTPPAAAPPMPALEDDASHGMSIERVAALEAAPPSTPATTALSSVLATAEPAAAAPQAEPGWQTSEFWVTVTTEAIGLLASAGVIGNNLAEKLTGIAGMVVAGAFYAVSRGLRKRGTAG